MNKGRLEAFSDGVIAIIITIMVLELKAPHGHSLADLRPLIPTFLSYALSFIYVGIYWNNHHHMLHAARTVNGPILWANLHLLFWLSLVPFTTAWMGDSSSLEPFPTAVYGIVLFGAAIAYTIVVRTIIASEGPGSRLKAAVKGDRKGWTSLLLYALAVPIALSQPRLAALIYIGVAFMWLIPDRRIEKHLHELT